MLGDETATHFNFMQPMLSYSPCYFSSLEVDIRKLSKYQPLETRFSWFSTIQVHIEIYEDKLGQSGDKIHSSHISN